MSPVLFSGKVLRYYGDEGMRLQATVMNVETYGPLMPIHRVTDDAGR